MEAVFIDTLLPLPLPGTFTYRVPREMENEIEIGKRVVVQFGRKKIYTALILKIHNQAPATNTAKYILSVLDQKPIVNNTMIEFWDWLSSYYICTRGEVMNAALPSGLKLQSESSVVLHQDFDGCIDDLQANELAIIDALTGKPSLSITEISDITNLQKVIPLINNMIEKNLIVSIEYLKETYKDKVEIYVKLNKEYYEDEKLGELLNKLEKKAFKQVEIIMAWMSLSGYLIDKNKLKDISRPQLLKKANSNSSVLKSLVNKGIMQLEKRKISRLENYKSEKSVDDIILSEAQLEAFNGIKKSFESHQITLLHGVTGSGKTEIYIKLIEEEIKKGKQVLYLLPEIALTTQIINRLKKYFGNKVGLYHSKYNVQEKIEIWNSVLDGNKEKHQIVLGARSSIFLPFNNLGLIVIDEEHDNSFKQVDPAPRYNARDAAIYLANQHNGAKVILGSATPCLETYHNAVSNKYGLVNLTSRFGKAQMPEILVADLQQEYKEKTMKSHFSSLLIKNMENALNNKEQIILFQNRRGFSLRLVCDKCSFTPKCKYCDVSLIYHKSSNKLKCHYCGYSIPVLTQCPECQSKNISMKGFGTEKVEDELSIIFPEAKIKRMDLDTTRNKNSYQQIINDFEDRKTDILVGTQMVTKGLDFDNVSIVGVLNADGMIYFPDFRAFEKSFQLLSQVSGRAGRKETKGKVILQSFTPYHSVIRYVIDNDYQSMYISQLQDRRRFIFPPYVRIVKISIKHFDFDFVNKASSEIGKLLRAHFGKWILGPEFPMVSRIRNQYIKEFLIKLPKDKNIARHKQLIKDICEDFNANKTYRTLRIVIDVDPI